MASPGQAGLKGWSKGWAEGWSKGWALASPPQTSLRSPQASVPSDDKGGGGGEKGCELDSLG